MKIFKTRREFQNYALELKRSGKSIALVPTMGFLHDGHMSLIDIARSKADVVMVSIFVNPTQFAPNEDFDRYPRDFDGDVAKCADHGADVIFAPEPGEMYDADASVWVEETSLSAMRISSIISVSLPNSFIRAERDAPLPSLPLPKRKL
jgi:pantoate--beta-alanine ligase